MADCDINANFEISLPWDRWTPSDSESESIGEDLVNAVQNIEAMEADESASAPNPPVNNDDATEAPKRGFKADDVDEGDQCQEQERFPSLDESDLDQLVSGATSKHTDKMTKWGVNVFRQWITHRGMDPNFENLTSTALDDILRRFYAEVRNSQGELYSKSTFVGIRASINRHLRNPPHNKSISIMENKEFHKSNQMFLAVLKKLKQEGHDKTAHHPPISTNDLQLLHTTGVLSTDTPRSLQRKVWFDVTINFARRGRENLRELRYDCFEFKFDDMGQEYAEMRYNESTKNHKGDNLKDKDFESKPRMYANGSNSCPITSLKKYLEKRNSDSDHLFQQPRPKVTELDSTWYTSRPVGVRVLNEMMKSISKDANLSRVYANHSVRATTITLLAHAGVETREIMKVSGHRNEASVRSYNADSSDAQKRAYSAIIQGQGAPATATSSISTHALPESTTDSSVVPYGSMRSSQLVQTASHPPSQHHHGVMPVTVNNAATYNRIVQCSQRPSYISYHGQFNVSNSTVNVYNYHAPQNRQ